MTTISRALLNDLLPPGSLWIPQDGEGFDLLLEGIAQSFEDIKIEVDKVGLVRFPLLTDVLSDLEKEFGIVPAAGLSESDRRASLLATKTARKSNGSADFIQQKLNEAGFDVQVHVNNPVVDPALFVEEQTFIYVCGGVGVICGRVVSPGPPNPLDVISGAGKGELLVNGDLIFRFSEILVVSGSPSAICGAASSICGSTLGPTENDVVYEIPTDPGYWGLIWFVGGDATRDPITGALTNIDYATIPSSRKNEFKRLILKYKPIHSWAGLVIRFT